MPDKAISLVDADPELGELLDEGDYERARRDALARVSRLSPGVWDAAAALDRDAHHRGFLIADGLMAREVDVMGRRCCELLGHGDVLRPWSWDAEGSHVQAEVGWTVLEETKLAVLDHGLVKRIVPWPTLGVELFNRGTRRAHHLAVALAISHHQRVDDRLLLTLWHLAERWGRVTPDGIVVPLPLGHQRLADLVGAHRPSVTTALGELGRGRVDLAPRRRQLGAARRAAGAAAPPQARLVDQLIWTSVCQVGSTKGPLMRAFLLVEGAAGRAGARRAVRLIFAGWLPQDRVSSQSPPSRVGCHRPRGRLPIAESRMLWREGPGRRRPLDQRVLAAG